MAPLTVLVRVDEGRIRSTSLDARVVGERKIGRSRIILERLELKRRREKLKILMSG